MADQKKTTPQIYHSVLSLEEIVKTVQANYALPSPVKASLLNSGVNDIYLVTAGGDKYILRLARVPRYCPFDEGAYRFELELLTFLRQQALPIAYPLPRRDGAWIGQLPTTGECSPL